MYSLIIGTTTLVFGILYFFPKFLYHGTVASISYSFVIILIIFSILIRIEAVDKLKAKKSYRFLFFYSYYSFTIYLTHYALYFVLLNKLNIYTLWAPMILTTILLGLLLRFVYKKLGPKASLKAGIGFLSYVLSKKIENIYKK